MKGYVGNTFRKTRVVHGQILFGVVCAVLVLQFVFITSIGGIVIGKTGNSEFGVLLLLLGIFGASLMIKIGFVIGFFDNMDRDLRRWKWLTVSSIVSLILLLGIFVYFAIRSSITFTNIQESFIEEGKCETSDISAVFFLIENIDCSDCLSTLETHVKRHEDILNAFDCQNMCGDCREHIAQFLSFSSILFAYFLWSTNILLLLLCVGIGLLAYLKLTPCVGLFLNYNVT